LVRARVRPALIVAAPRATRARRART